MAVRLLSQEARLSDNMKSLKRWPKIGYTKDTQTKK